MVSPNAFATRSKSVHRRSDSVAGGKRPSKRLRLSSEDATIQTQCANAETALEVDVMILDYLAYRTITTSLVSRNAEPTTKLSTSLHDDMLQTDKFFAIFKARHASYKPDLELRFRNLLLQLAVLFSQRLTRNSSTPSAAALRDSRAQHQHQARQWIGSAEHAPTEKYHAERLDTDFPITPESLEQNRAHMLNHLQIPDEDEAYEDAFYGTPACVSLLDLLPLFMRISAARNAMSGSNLTAKWMELAGDFIMQACLEQYLIFGANGSDAVDQAFAWGYKPNHDADNEKNQEGVSPEDEVNDMFQDEDYLVEVTGWSDVKAYYLGELLPGGHQDGSLVAQFERLATEFPVSDFENRVLEFLAGLHGSIAAPILVQLEEGRLDGLTVDETQKFVCLCGIRAARFFEAPLGFKGVRD